MKKICPDKSGLTVFEALSFNLTMQRILGQSKSGAFANDKINATRKLKILGREESLVGKDKNAGNKNCLLFLQCIQMASP